MKRTLLIKVDFGNGLIAFQFKTKVQVKNMYSFKDRYNQEFNRRQ
jgi:hypothetical protein